MQIEEELDVDGGGNDEKLDVDAVEGKGMGLEAWKAFPKGQLLTVGTNDELDVPLKDWYLFVKTWTEKVDVNVKDTGLISFRCVADPTILKVCSIPL